MKRSRRTRSWKRVALALAAAAVLAVPLTYYGGRYALNRRFLGWRDQGLAAASAGDHARAADLLGRYLKRRPDEMDTWSLYVKSREQAELPNGQHLVEAIGALQFLLSKDPGRLDDRRHLLELYAKLDRRPEAVDTANLLLARAPKDTRALELKTEILARQHLDREALAAAQAWTAAAPSDVKAHMARLSLRSRLGQPLDGVVSEAGALRDGHPDDPRFELLLGYAYSLANDPDQAGKWLKAAAGHVGLDDALAQVLVEQLDGIGMSRDALGVLKGMVNRGAGETVRNALARRLWELGRWAEAADALRDLDAAAPQSDPALCAMKAMALANSGKSVEADACRDALASRGQAAARAWALVLRRGTVPAVGPLNSSATTSGDDRQFVAECRSALALDRRNPYLHYYLGEAYARMAELDLAAQAWQFAAAQAPSWPMPSVRLVEALLQKGQTAQAMTMALNSARRHREYVASAVTYARAWASAVEAGVAGDEDGLLKLADDILAAVPGEENTLLVQVQALGHKAQKAEKDQESARGRALAALRSAVARTPAPAERVLLGLASASRRYGLGAEQECFAACEKAHGATPVLAYAWAVDKLIGGDAAAGLRQYDEVATRATGPTRTTATATTGAAPAAEAKWRLGRAQYLDLTGGPDARPAWAALGDAFPDDVAVQHAAASSRAAAGDWDFMPRTVERRRKLTGEGGLAWRLAQARLMVQFPRTEDDYVKGSVLLNDVIKEYPRSVEARMLLAAALARMKRLDGAIEHLSAALNYDPGAVPARLQLAGLLLARGDLERGRQELEQATPMLRSPAERRQAALLLAQQGNRDRAVQLMEQQASAPGAGAAAEGQDELLLAVLYRRNRQFDKAEAAAHKLLDREPPDLGAVEFAVSLFAGQGRRDDAEKALKRLDAAKDLEPGVKELAWGSYHAQLGELDKAVARYRAATREAPANAAAWRVLATSLVAQGRGDEAMAAVADALGHLPQDNGLAVIRDNAELLRKSASDAGLRQLAMAVVRDPLGSEAARELLRAVTETRASNDMDRTASRLQQVVTRFPEFLPARVQLVQCYLAMGRGADALDAVRRAMKDFPADPAPARMAVQVFGEAQRWEEVRAAAQGWKQRAPDEALAADVAIARAAIGQSQNEAAAAQLRPYLAAASANPNRYANLLTTYCLAVARGGNSEAAADMLWPLASKPDGAAWRARWVQVAVDLSDSAEAAHWLDRLGQLVRGGALEERVVLAQAYDNVAERGADAALARKSAALFDEVLAGPKVPAGAVMLAGAQAERVGDAARAEALYRRALSIDPNLFAAQNNLAMLIASRGGDLGEAMTLSSAAVKLQPRQATLYDTMAFVQGKSGNYTAAADNMRTAISLEPDNVKWRVRLAQYLLDGGRASEAAREIAGIDDRRLDLRSLPPALRQQLDSIRKQVRGAKPT
jgi:tetratricopeptide (TPR) repeat protein